MDKTISYEGYQEMPNSISVERMDKIYHKIIDNAPSNDSKYDELFDAMVRQAAVYAGYRAKWLNMTLQEHLDIDEERTRNHNLFISKKNELVTYSYSIKKNIEWDDMIGSDRKSIGDFACYITFIRSLCAR